MRLEIDATGFYDRLDGIFAGERIIHPPNQMGYTEQSYGEEVIGPAPAPARLGIYGEEVLLPEPFSRLQATFSRDGDRYTARCSFYGVRFKPSKEGRDALYAMYEDISDSFAKQLGSSWVPAGNHGEGLIVNEGIPIAALMHNGDEEMGDCAEITIGDMGTQPRKYGVMDEFYQMTGFLEKLSEQYANASIDWAVEKGRLENNPDLRLLIRP